MLSSQATVRGLHLHIALKFQRARTGRYMLAVVCLLCNTARLVVLSMPLQYFQCLAPIQCFLEHKCFAIICQHNHACSLLFSLWPPIDFPHSSVQLKCSSFGKRQSWYLFVTHIDFLATFFLLKGNIGRFI